MKFYICLTQGLDSTLNFFRERIIEYTLPSTDGPLITSTVKEFVMSVAARTSAPGGGSVSALVAALVSFLNEFFFHMGYAK